VAAGLLVWAAGAGAQAPSGLPRVTLALVSAAPADALDQLAAASGISVVADARVLAAAAGRRVSCRSDGDLAERVLRCIVHGAGLDYYRLSSGTYVVVESARAALRPGTVAGVVVDAATGEPVPHARLTLAERSETRPAGAAGAFGFSGLAPGRYRLLATAMGYAPSAAEVEVGPDGAVRARVALRPLPVPVAPVVVNGIAPLPGSGRVGQDTVADDALARAFLYGGGMLSAAAPGLIGVAQRSSFGELHIQGGASGEQLIRIDGAPVFDPVSLGRVFGGVAPLAVGRLTVHKAGFGAGVGSAAGSVVDLTHTMADDGAPPAAVAQADPYSATARVSGGWRAGETPVSAVVTGRTSVWGMWRAPALDRALRAWNAPDAVLAERLYDVRELPTAAAAGGSTLDATDLHLAVRARPGAFRTVHASAYRGVHGVGSEWVSPAGAGPTGAGPADAAAWAAEHGRG
jgi:hypothetical protein